jgi:hypothetical protein
LGAFEALGRALEEKARERLRDARHHKTAVIALGGNAPLQPASRQPSTISSIHTRKPWPHCGPALAG